VRVVIIEKIDRLARDVMLQETIIADLRKHGFELMSVAEPDLMENDPTRKQMRRFMGSYRRIRQIPNRAQASRRENAQAGESGRCEGRKPYGYYEGESAALNGLKALRAEGLGFHRIAARLNAEGIPTRTGKAWHGIVVNRILTGKR